MPRSLKRLTGPVVSALLASIVATTLPAQPARADDYWRESKRYTAAIKQAAVDAARKLKQAKNILDNATRGLSAAQSALGAATSIAESQAALDALAAASAAVAEASAAVAAASEALAVAAAAVAAFMAGTLAGEGLGFLISYCWDPICYYDSSNPYAWPLSDDVDLWIPALLHNGAGVDMTRADFDEADAALPGSGTASWNYLRETARCFAISARGAASFTAGHYTEMPAATSNLNASLARYVAAVNDFAPRLTTMTTYNNDPRPSIQSAYAALDNLAALIGDFRDQSNIQGIIDQVHAALDQATQGLDLASDAGGNPLPIDGPGGVLDPLSLQEFQQFLTDCANQGAAASPPAEALAVDGLMSQLGITPHGQASMGPAIASWDGAGDQANESSLFIGGQDMPLSQVLLTSLSFNWQQINLDTSPLVYLSAPAATSFEPPFYTGSPAGLPLNYNGWQNIGTRAPMSIYQYAGNSLLIPGNPAGAGAQFAGCQFPIGGTTVVQRQEPTMHGVTTLWEDFYVRRPATVPAGSVMADIELVPLSLSSVAGSHQLYFSGLNPNTFECRYSVYNAAGTPTPSQIAPGAMPLQFNRWYRSMMTVDLDANQVVQVGMIDLTTNAATRTAPPQPWYLQGGAGPHQPVGGIRIVVNPQSGGAFAFDNYSPYSQDRCVTNNWTLAPETIQSGQSAVFTALPNAAGPLSFQWRKDGLSLTDDGRITGANTSTLEIYPAQPSDSGSYDVLISNACNSLASNAAMLTVQQTCGSVDFNCDGDLGTDADIEAFFACLAGNCPAPPCNSTADFNGDGDIGTDADIEAFFRVLAGGTC